jgi:hypothetical protein
MLLSLFYTSPRERMPIFPPHNRRPERQGFRANKPREKSEPCGNLYTRLPICPNRSCLGSLILLRDQ